ncbi:hypothetical protein [Gimesia sp.]|uniref:hypothetical protein n=1 Tax=Gimesia sp. TaxID=2024833 RepID=UPI0032EEB219
MKIGETKEQFVWKDGKRVPFKATAIQPKKPEEYNPPDQAEQVPQPQQKPQEAPKAAGSK